MRSKLIAAAAVAIGVSMATVACSASTPAPPRSAATHAKVKRAATATRTRRPGSVPGARRARHELATAPGVRAANRPFGTGCAQLPRTDGTGGHRGLPRLPVATAMAQIPLLSELSRAIRMAGLTTMLNTARSVTIFAPDDAAFAVLGTGNVQTLLSTRADLARVVKFQVVAGRVRPVQLARRAVLTTIAGTKIYAARADSSYYVNNAWISCGNLRTANATVYIVNRVVIPAT